VYKTTSLKYVTTYERDSDENHAHCTVSGERNSGTTFLAELLRKHGLIVYDGLCVYNLQLTWKHDFARNDLKLVGPNPVNIFIVRDLDKWLITTYHKPYYLHMERYEPLFGFIFRKQRLSKRPNIAKTVRDGKVLNHTDENKTIFEIRYEKLQSYIKFFNENTNVVIVKLEYLQNEENCIYFMQQLSQKYGFKFQTIYGCMDKHTKTGRPNEKNIKYSTVICPLTRAIINLKKNEELENYVNNLTFEMK
jgi:hypothetical protein